MDGALDIFLQIGGLPSHLPFANALLDQLQAKPTKDIILEYANFSVPQDPIPLTQPFIRGLI